MPTLRRRWLTASILIAVFSLQFSSCENYPYESPQPGTLEIYMGVKNSRDITILPFGPTSFYPMSFTDLQARRPDATVLRIFSDLTAIRRSPELFNCLSEAARDSSIILGKVYAPPGDYTVLEIRAQFGDSVLVFVPDQRFTNIFPVRDPAGVVVSDLNILSGVTIPVAEFKTTRVVVTLDLDSTLTRRTESFELHPTFYISSIATF
jgi:hypothetical protein